MGAYASRIVSVSNIAVNSVYRTRKRKCIEEDLDPESEFIDRTLQTPKRYVVDAPFTHRDIDDYPLFLYIHLSLSQEKITDHRSVYIQNFIPRRKRQRRDCPYARQGVETAQSLYNAGASQFTQVFLRNYFTILFPLIFKFLLQNRLASHCII